MQHAPSHTTHSSQLSPFNFFFRIIQFGHFFPLGLASSVPLRPAFPAFMVPCTVVPPSRRSTPSTGSYLLMTKQTKRCVYFLINSMYHDSYRGRLVAKTPQHGLPLLDAAPRLNWSTPCHDILTLVKEFGLLNSSSKHPLYTK